MKVVIITLLGLSLSHALPLSKAVESYDPYQARSSQNQEEVDEIISLGTEDQPSEPELPPVYNVKELPNPVARKPSYAPPAEAKYPAAPVSRPRDYSPPPKQEYPVARPLAQDYYRPAPPAYSKPPVVPDYPVVKAPVQDYSKPAPPSYSKPIVPEYPVAKAPAQDYQQRPVQKKVTANRYQAEDKDEYPTIPAVYNYGFNIQNEEGDLKFVKNENRDGEVLTGSYTVALPDGRTQIVTYTADAERGFVADVKYEGEAVYPEYVPKPKEEKPVYKAPVKSQKYDTEDYSQSYPEEKYPSNYRSRQ